MKEQIQKILIYLLNKTGFFITLNVDKMVKGTGWKHYSANISFWGRRKGQKIEDFFVNGELEDFGVWSRHLTNKEIKGLYKNITDLSIKKGMQYNDFTKETTTN